MDNLVKRTIRIDSSVNNKIKYIAEMEGRSVNKEIELYLKKSIKAYEEKYGVIKMDEDWFRIILGLKESLILFRWAPD